MAEEISYNYLWQAYQKEKQTNQLLLIPKTFYQDTIEHIKKAKSEPNPNFTMIDNTTKLLNEFFEKRKQKIMIYIAFNKQLPKPVADSELEFYNRLLQVARSEVLELSVATKKNTITLKSVKDIPEIILPSGNRLGPLKRDQMVDAISEQDINYLIENAICEQV